MKAHNRFGQLSADYKIARRGYPNEAYAYLSLRASDLGKKTLDVGCGTGISTRELASKGFEVEGLDKEQCMLGAAIADSPDIKYTLGSVEKMPYEDESYDIVTAFTSFHWFDNERAAREIMRVLKPGGLFFAALKDSISVGGSKESTDEYVSILKKYVGEDYKSAKDYAPDELLRASGFERIEDRAFPYNEYHTVEESLTLMKSLSFWNLVKDNERESYLSELRDFFQSHLTEGKVVRNREIEVISGYKSR